MEVGVFRALQRLLAPGVGTSLAGWQRDLKIPLRAAHLLAPIVFVLVVSMHSPSKGAT